jgi:hypothetical protein
MNLAEMRTLVRRDLGDEASGNYRWSDDEIDRHITHALKDFSEALPREQKALIATVSGSREISLSSLTNRVMIEAVEYPVGLYPVSYQRFAFWQDMMTLLGPDVPDGAVCCVYYGQLHTLDSSGSTIPAIYEELIASGAAGYAAVQQGVYAIDRVNTGGSGTPQDWENRGRHQLAYFRSELKRSGRRNRVRMKQLYVPYNQPLSRTTDMGPG